MGGICISIRMIKICDESIAYPLKIMFDTTLKLGIFPEKWEKANIILVHKKENKNIKKSIDQYHYYLYVEIYLKNVFLTLFIHILNLIIYYRSLNLVFGWVILVYHSCWQ